MIKKLMKVRTETLSYHVICYKCNKYLGKYSNLKGDIPCKCGNIVSPSAMGLFFVDIDITDQLTKLFSDLLISNSLEKRF